MQDHPALASAVTDAIKSRLWIGFTPATQENLEQGTACCLSHTEDFSPGKWGGGGGGHSLTYLLSLHGFVVEMVTGALQLQLLLCALSHASVCAVLCASRPGTHTWLLTLIVWI